MGLWTMEILITFLLVNCRASISGLSILDKSQPAWQDRNSSHGCKGLAEGLRQKKRNFAVKMVELHVQGYFKHVFSTIQYHSGVVGWNMLKHPQTWLFQSYLDMPAFSCGPLPEGSGWWSVGTYIYGDISWKFMWQNVHPINMI